MTRRTQKAHVVSHRRSTSIIDRTTVIVGSMLGPWAGKRSHDVRGAPSEPDIIPPSVGADVANGADFYC
jgi:hypothetical protein